MRSACTTVDIYGVDATRMDDGLHILMFFHAYLTSTNIALKDRISGRGEKGRGGRHLVKYLSS